ncbi:MAG TPA: multiprotein bridging factor aMBF1 [Candidatus Nanoarchaeia archaeon]|nr:multiprotein bridging factor aMBF1 [Candidatus Nanoarchaeia archaeon]
MPSCELCGTPGETVRALVESVEVRVCTSCTAYGEILSSHPLPARNQPVPAAQRQLHVIVPDYAARIKASREKLGLSQEAFARLLNEKRTVIHVLEVGKVAPSMPLARKLERILKIRLIEEYQETSVPRQQHTASFTLGDFIKIKKEQ